MPAIARQGEGVYNPNLNFSKQKNRSALQNEQQPDFKRFYARNKKEALLPLKMKKPDRAALKGASIWLDARFKTDRDRRMNDHLVGISCPHFSQYQ